ncbi:MULTISPECIES: hypothetical protein [unclassified Nocardioides]|uniref:hypothetical protein n=1 Tax=unclassified Nocardioides TaxID=2615069 RepID=UPI000701C2E5|nr:MULTISPECIES: hypothetical protein [unclassified Nocardioides]KRA39176.1 hypothetical protein ASD81_11670 [Nocardioides sp. Root614]KRA93135.1 hypothetical protein ASD84_11935 [Nocardioides sp. Root682]
MHDESHACRSTASGSTEVGTQLAAWLDELDLAQHLGEAGLPTFERDADGVAHWRDPATGLPMNADQIEALDRMLHQDGDDPAHAVPLALVQLRRQARVRTALLATASHGYASLAEVRGTSENSTRFAVHKAAERHALLVVSHDGGTLIPAFQLDDAGEVRAELVPVLEPLLASTMDAWQVWAWLTQPAGLLGGAVPHEAARDSEEAAIVRHAAVRLAERAVR